MTGAVQGRCAQRPCIDVTCDKWNNIMAKKLVIYGRSGCHLCDEMEREVRALQPEWGFSLEVLDVERDPELEERYGERVPVLLGGDREICHYFLDRAALIRYLSAD